MALMRTYDSSMEIHSSERHVFLTMGSCSQNGTNFVHQNVYCKNIGKQQNINYVKHSKHVSKLTSDCIRLTTL